MKFKTSFFLGSVLIFFILVTACTQKPDCDNDRPFDAITVVFYDKEAETLTKLDTIFRSVTAIGSEASFRSEMDSSYSTYVLELDPLQEKTTYVFELATVRDTLEITYTKQLEWLSEECGPRHRFENMKVSFETFDSISVVEELINQNVSENIRLFY